MSKVINKLQFVHDLIYKIKIHYNNYITINNVILFVLKAILQGL
jgi:hypothetical protein